VPPKVPRQRPRRLAIAGVAALALAALCGLLVYPTLPSYDSLYSLVWAREILDGVAPSLDAYRAPTEHPLGVAVAIVLVALPVPAAHAYVALTLASFVALIAGVVRLGATSFGILAGLVAGALLLARPNFAFLAAFGYVDVPYLALLVWAACLVAGDVVADERRARTAVRVMLATAGLLRPEGWAFAALYAAWIWRGADGGTRLRALLWLAAAPALWVLSDLAMTGDPLFSWTYTSGLADTLGRDRGLGHLPGATLASAVDLVKLPVLVLALAGLAHALWREPRRAAVPLALTAGGVATFLAISTQGFSVIPRYLAAGAAGAFVFAGYALGGWRLLAPGSAARRGWMLVAALGGVAGVAFAVTSLNPAKVDAELRLRERVYADVDAVLRAPAFRAARRCGPISLPTHALIPYVRWRLRLGRRDVVSRSDRSALARASRGGAALVVRDVRGIRSHPAFGPRNGLDPPSVRPAPPGFALVVATNAITGWARCAAAGRTGRRDPPG
jgi:hypothetical protein